MEHLAIILFWLSHSLLQYGYTFCYRQDRSHIIHLKLRNRKFPPHTIAKGIIDKVTTRLAETDRANTIVITT